MSVLIESSRFKMHRAAKHMEAAEKISDDFLRGNFYEFTHERNAEGYLIARVTRVDQFPVEFGLVIGDAVHNMRSALDHIAYIFASPKTNQIAFPTISDPTKFPENIKRRLPGVSPEALALFEKYQPYNSGNFSDNKLLLYVSAINNWDKHCALPIALASIHYFEVAIKIDGGGIELGPQELHGGKLEPGTILTKIKATYLHGKPKVTMDAKTLLHPIFDDSMPDVAGVPVLDSLARAGAFIFDKIIPDFEKLL